MAALHNKYDKETLRRMLEEEGLERTTISFYQYHHVKDPNVLRDEFYLGMESLGVLGRIYVAKEGVNAQISIPSINEPKLRAFFNDNYPWLKDIRFNYAREERGISFLKLKIKVREKIVADGLNDDTFDVTNKGVHLSAEEFNELTSKEGVVLIDMRNHYETEIGHFKGAITPDVDTFRESLPVIVDDQAENKEKPVVMYCTGGIRCEKASAYFKHRGFKDVYQLEGGIIEYHRQVEEKGLENRFLGKNFVFDDRRAEGISGEVIGNCHQCNAAWDVHENCANDACHLLFLQCPDCKDENKGCCSEECQEFMLLPDDLKKDFKSGMDFGTQTFKKGRESLFVPAYNKWKARNEERVSPYIERNEKTN